MTSSGRLVLLAGAGLALLTAGVIPTASQAQAQACGATYTVRAGDTMGSIAGRCSTSVEALLKANPAVRDPARISIGQELTVPRPASAVAEDWARVRDARAAPLLAAGRYTVESGDSLASIATKLGVELRSLLAANEGIDPFSLRPGQELSLPGDAAGVAAQDGDRTAAADPAEGDPAGAEPSAAERSAGEGGTPVAAPDDPPADLAQAAEREPSARYVIRAGDSMAGIARAHGIPLQALMQANRGVRPRGLRPGQELVLPTGAGAQGQAASDTARGDDEAAAADGETVGAGDRADAETTPGADAQAAPEADSETGPDELASEARPVVGAGRDDEAPEGSGAAEQPRPDRYTIRPGDSLGAIARAHGISVAALTAVNEGIRPRALKPGDELILPDAATAAADAPAADTDGSAEAGESGADRRYTVRQGDSLAGIAAAHGVSLQALAAANPGVRPRALRPGQLLVLPQGAATNGPGDAEAETATETATGDAAGAAEGQGDQAGAGPAPDEPVAGSDGNAPAAEDEDVAANEPQRMMLVGRIYKGVECPVLRTPEGVTYSLVSQAYSFTPGDYVSIEAEPVEMSFCMQGQTIRVTSMTEVPSPG